MKKILFVVEAMGGGVFNNKDRIWREYRQDRKRGIIAI